MKHLLLTLLCLLAPVAYGATQLEALRAGASAARAQVNGTRAGQLQSQAELNKLASRIEDLKAQAKGKLLPGGELDSALKRSQELSASLNDAASSLSTQQSALENANLALLSELSNELSRARTDFDRSTDRTVRTQLIGKMRALRAEREKVRAALPAAKLPALETIRPSDDPEDLLEQADLLKDNEDKVRRQLQAVEKRITEAKEERDLDNRVRQFLGDEALFDEGDRRLRVSATRQQALEPAANADQASPPPPQRLTAGETGGAGFKAQNDAFTAQAGSPTPPGQNPVGVQSPGAGGLGGRGINEAADPGAKTTNTNPPAVPQARKVEGTDSKPTVGGHIAGNDEDDDLEDLEIQRAKLKGLAEELKARASQLQKKAAQLK